MKFLIVTHVVHKEIQGKFFAYGPYVREMNLWFNHVSEVIVVAPKRNQFQPDPIDLAYEHPKIVFVTVPEFDFLTWRSRTKAIVNLPLIFAKTLLSMSKADHIHLRCPGNMGLVGAVAQFFFPGKPKTAKYAGNWDPKSLQPFTYRLQQRIISNTFFSKKMKVLVYGDWGSSNPNLVSFFTASYHNNERVPTQARLLGINQLIRLIFVGSLHPGKNPQISCETVVELRKRGLNVRLDLFGEGQERQSLQHFIEVNKLTDCISLHGNVSSETLKRAYQESHFLVFASESEGWPKAVAESMFWACLPLTTAVSCVPQMIGEDKRGVLVSKNAEEIADKIYFLLRNSEVYSKKCEAAKQWARNYTLERFREEINKLLLN